MVGLAWHQGFWKTKTSSNSSLFFNGKHSYYHQNHHLIGKGLFTVKKARKMLSFSLIKFTGNNTVPAQQQISGLAAAPFFWGDHLGKYHFTTKKEKEASTECNPQPAPATWQPACMEKQNTIAVLQIRASNYCQGICKTLKEVASSRPCLKLVPYQAHTQSSPMLAPQQFLSAVKTTASRAKMKSHLLP